MQAKINVINVNTHVVYYDIPTFFTLNAVDELLSYAWITGFVVIFRIVI